MGVNGRADLESIRDQYSNLGGIWVDTWHRKTYYRIRRYVQRFAGSSNDCTRGLVLNQGSGGNSYDITADCHIHLDVVRKSLENVAGAVLGNAESLPFPDETFDLCICVGSVVNYCDAALLVAEASRVLKNSGVFLLEFERSESAEYIGNAGYGQHQSRMATEYGSQRVELWFYSEPFMTALLAKNGFAVRSLARFHVISPLVYRITRRAGFSGLFAELDFLASRVPVLRKLSTNAILLAKKTD